MTTQSILTLIVLRQEVHGKSTFIEKPNKELESVPLHHFLLDEMKKLGISLDRKTIFIDA